MSLPSLVTFFVIVVTVIISDTLCIGIQPNVNSWGTTSNNNAPATGPKLNPSLGSTTPWPALGQNRNQQQNAQQPVRATNQPMWVRPDNGPNWVRNSPSPSRNGASVSNTNFLNNERGVLPNQPNQRQNSNKPVQSQASGSQNSNLNSNANNNAMRGTSGGQNLNSNQNNNAMGGTMGLPQPFGSQNLNSNQNNRAMSPLQPFGGQNLNTNKNNNAMRGSGGGSQNSNSASNNNMRGVVSAGSLVGNKDNADEVANEGSETGDVEDFELREFAEELLTKDTNNAARYVTVNVQGMTTSRSSNDEAPNPLFTIDSKVYSIPSVEKLVLLYNNYILESNQNEVYTAQEKIEENNLLDTILPTSVMQHTRNFLIKKGRIGKDPKEFKDLLRSIWFGMYSRGQGRIGSSGFEHVFLAELKNKQVSGLHNWLYFNEEEKKKNANYLGYLKKIDLGTKGSILKYHFTFHDVDKPVGSMFIGTSPELEIALYSTCFILRADRICPLKMDGKRFIIRTYTYRYRGKNMIGSAFPEI